MSLAERLVAFYLVPQRGLFQDLPSPLDVGRAMRAAASALPPMLESIEPAEMLRMVASVT